LKQDEKKMTPKPRGLGRGLDALFDDEEATFAATGAENKAPDASSASLPPVTEAGPRRTLGVGQLVPNPDQPRTHFDPTALNDLAGSIKQHGLLQPILVRPMAGNPDMYEIVAGERRWRASQKAQLHEVPVVIREMSDEQVLQIALIENLQRQDLNAIEEAKGYQRLIDDYAYTAEALGEAVNKSRSHVSNLVRLLALPQSVQDKVVAGDLTAGHARALLSSENPALMAQEIIAKGLSVRQAEKLVADSIGREIQKRGAGKHHPTFKDPNILAMEKDLTNILGMKVQIQLQGEGPEGQLTIDFKTLDQFDEIALRLSKIPKVIS
jgi:ParB family chromosome partitioning protein